MTGTSPQPPFGAGPTGPTPSDMPADPTGAPPKRSGKWAWVLIAALGVLAFLGSGIATYLTQSNARSGPGPADCGRRKCIPTLTASAVVDALKKQGYDCKDDHGWACELEIGNVRYNLMLTTNQTHISDLYATVSYPEDIAPTAATLSYLTWIASMPYANDKAVMSDIKRWVEQQVEKGESTKAKIGGYGYELEIKNNRYIALSVRTVVPL